MPELHFTISIRNIFIILALIASAAGTILVYRITIPPVSKKKHFILIMLRSSGIFLIFLLIYEPLLSLITYSLEQPVVAVLIDDSRSMSIQDRTGRRGDVLKSILKSGTWNKISEKGEVAFAVFDGKLHDFGDYNADSLRLEGELTDIAEALKSVKRIFGSYNLQAAVLITDGNSTSGMNPVYESEELGVPVFTIGIGDTSEQKDILVKKVLTNEVAYAGAKVPLHTTIRSSGFGGERVQITLKHGAAVLEEKMLILERGTRDYQVQFSYVPEQEGIQKYGIDVSSLPGEITLNNNHMNIFIKVLKSKLRVVLIAGAPGPDVAFIRRSLIDDKNIELKSFIEQNENKFYEGALTSRDLQNIDCLVLVGVPGPHSNSWTIQYILDAANSELPIMTVLSRTMDFEKISQMDQILPFTAENIKSDESQIFIDVPESQRNSPILKTGDGINTMELWSKLPPVFRIQGTIKPKAGSQVLASIRYQSVKSEEPFIVTRNLSRKKSLSVIGYGLWRWKALSDDKDESENIFDSFLNNAIRWLTTREDEKRIIVKPVKNIFSTQDAVEFAAQVYNDNYQPVDDAEVEVTAKHRNETNPLVLNPLGSGQYRAEYNRLPEGEYEFTASVTENGNIIGSDKGTFSVGGFNAEYLETRMNKFLLQQIAVRTGGRYYNGNKMDRLSDDISLLQNFLPRSINRSREIEIWNSRWILAVIIGIFAAEWVMRKQNGML